MENTSSDHKISRKNSIRFKLIAIMVAVTAIPLIVAVLVSYYTSTNKALADAQDSMEWQGRYIEDRFASIIDTNMSVIKTLAVNPTVINFVKGEGGIPYDAVQLTLYGCDQVLGDGENTSVVNTEGMQIARGKGNFVSVADRDYFQAAIKGQDFVSCINVSKTNGRRIITFSTPIVDNGQILGIVHRNYDLENFHELLANEADHAFMVDRNGQVAAHSQYSIGGDGGAEEEFRTSALFYTSSSSEGFYLGDIGNGHKAYLSFVKEPVSNYVVCTVKEESDVLASARKAASIVVAVGIGLLAIAVVISIFMAQSFIKPIKAVAGSLTELSDGRFSKVDGFDARKDEFGLISRAMNSVIEKLNEIVANIKNSATDVGSSSEDLADMADQISKTAEDVSTAVQEIATGATQQADEIQEATENVGYIGEAVANVKESSGNLTELAGKMKKASEVSGKSLSSLQESSAEMTAKIDEISRTIEATENAVASISEKVEGITSIATQTNLLSLNASIEAARAGEAGKGFAVVAEEIGKLADDSGRMADEIRVEMEKLLTQSKAAVSAAEDVKKGNDTQQVALGETLEAVNGMLEDINSTVEGVDTISHGAETCETSKNAVVDTMSALSAISEENAASAEETGASMQELSATVTTLASSAQDLKDIAEKLNEDMKFF
ncbi:MAG: methyl-accepting chemotaxis protein, partial [Lachnospiraceae bacterium]|nr:methyl-accepting chemotaxis protein [Lachnospiraceae bacterium]